MFSTKKETIMKQLFGVDVKTASLSDGHPWRAWLDRETPQPDVFGEGITEAAAIIDLANKQGAKRKDVATHCQECERPIPDHATYCILLNDEDFWFCTNFCMAQWAKACLLGSPEAGGK